MPGAFIIYLWSLEPRHLVGTQHLLETQHTVENTCLEPPAFINVSCSRFMLILLFVLIISVYVYLVS